MNLVKTIFTAFVVALIVLPVPPTTIIGLALVSNPKTSKFVDDRAMFVVNSLLSGIRTIARWKLDMIVASNMIAAQAKISHNR